MFYHKIGKRNLPQHTGADLIFHCGFIEKCNAAVMAQKRNDRMDIFHFDNMGKISDRHIFQRQCFCEDGAGAGAGFAHEEPFACQIGKCVDRLCKMVVAGSNGNIFFGTVYAGFIHFF